MTDASEAAGHINDFNNNNQLNSTLNSQTLDKSKSMLNIDHAAAAHTRDSVFVNVRGPSMFTRVKESYARDPDEIGGLSAYENAATNGANGANQLASQVHVKG